MQQKERIMSLFLTLLQSLHLDSKIDWVTTRYYRVIDWCKTMLWKAGLTQKIPPSELDLTELLDEADFKNKQMDAFK